MRTTSSEQIRSGHQNSVEAEAEMRRNAIEKCRPKSETDTIYVPVRTYNDDGVCAMHASATCMAQRVARATTTTTTASGSWLLVLRISRSTGRKNSY